MRILFYPTIAALLDSNRLAVYTIAVRQAIHDRVTSEINFAKMQMAAILSLDSSWLMNDDVWLHKCC